MIRADDVGVAIIGNTMDVFAEFIMVIRSIRTMIASESSEEVADKIIADLGKLAYCDPDDEETMRIIIENSELLKGEKE